MFVTIVLGGGLKALRVEEEKIGRRKDGGDGSEVGLVEGGVGFSSGWRWRWGAQVDESEG